MKKQDNPWQLFYEKTAAQPPEPTLVKALRLFANSDVNKFAIDLGCGAGRDTLWLIRNGWQVLAVDAQPSALAHIKLESIKLNKRSFLKTHVASFEELNLTAYPSPLLINASYALPFCGPVLFEGIWTHLMAHLQKGGVTCGQLFGTQHSWAGQSHLCFFSKDQAANLLSSLTIKFFKEEKRDGTDVEGNPVYWHVFHFVAKK